MDLPRAVCSLRHGRGHGRAVCPERRSCGGRTAFCYLNGEARGHGRWLFCQVRAGTRGRSWWPYRRGLTGSSSLDRVGKVLETLLELFASTRRIAAGSPCFLVLASCPDALQACPHAPEKPSSAPGVTCWTLSLGSGTGGAPALSARREARPGREARGLVLAARPEAEDRA